VLALAAVLAMSAGCAAERRPSSLAVLEVGPEAFLESIDGQAQPRSFRSEPVDLSPGRHTVRLRRRVEVPAPAHQTPDLEAVEWLYYIGPGRGEYVTIERGVIGSIRVAPAP
jgi:hypothetical protein